MRVRKTLTAMEFLNLPAGTKLLVSYDCMEVIMALPTQSDVIQLDPKTTGESLYLFLSKKPIQREYEIFIGSDSISITLK